MHNTRIRWCSCSWRLSHVEQEILTFPKQLDSPFVFSVVRVSRFFIFYVLFLCRSLFLLLSFFLLTIVLSALFLFTIVLSVLFLLAIVLSVLFLLAIVLFVLLRFCGFWLPLWCLQAILISLLRSSLLQWNLPISITYKWKAKHIKLSKHF